MGRFLLFGVILAVALWIAVHLVGERTVHAPGAPPAALPSAPPPRASPPEIARALLADAGASAHENPLSDVLCPSGMLFVEATYCVGFHPTCLRTVKGRCEKFAVSDECGGSERRLRFCIDRYEYPNLVGVVPAGMVHFNEARDTCRAEGKRLCGEAEWTLACEGEERRPFPYGFRFQPEACNLGPAVDSMTWQLSAAPAQVPEKIGLMDVRSASGSRPGCVSSGGVSDLLGNVEEWVVSQNPSFQAALKGGDFHQEYATCRQTTNVAQRFLRLPYNGFRCCSDPLGDGHDRAK